MSEMTIDNIRDREWINNRIRELRAQRDDYFGKPVYTDGWDLALLNYVVQNGLAVLTTAQLKWLYNNPIALFTLHKKILECGGVDVENEEVK